MYALVFFLLITGMVVFFISSLNRRKIVFEIDGKSACIRALLYSYKFDLSEVQDIIMLARLPNGIRVNGYSTIKKTLVIST